MEESSVAEGESNPAEVADQMTQATESPMVPHPLAHSAPPQPYYHPHQQEQQQQQYSQIQSSSFGSTSMWMGAGAVLGLTAAATVRWLNGGDFHLFPPPNSEQQLPPEEQDQQFEERAPTDFPDSSFPHASSASFSVDQSGELRTELRSLVDAIHQQNKTQTNLVQQLVRREDVQLVNDSMNVLRQQSSSNDHTSNVDEQLTKLEQQMADLRQRHGSMNDQEREEALDQMLQIIQDCRKEGKSNEISTTKLRPVSTNSPQPQSTPVINRNAPTASNAAESSGSEKDARVLTGETETGLAALGSALQILKKENTLEQLQQGIPLLYLYVHNLHQHSQMPRYRKIFTSNESFGTKVQPLVGGKDILRAVGFVEQVGCWEWLPAGTNDKKEADNGNSITQAALEKEHLEYLSEAAHALQELKKQVVQGASPANFSPVRPPSSNGADTPLEGPFPQTPDPSIQSPPVPKKQIFFMPESNDSVLSPVEEHKHQTSPAKDDMETVNAMWK